jgi:ribosomal protein S3AE
MARFFKTTILICLVLLTGCQEGGEAGDLFGQWRMTDTHYVSFSGSIARLHDTTAGEVYGNFQHVGDSLFIQCYSVKAEKADTTMVEESFGFKPFQNIRVKIAALDNDQLVITKGSQTWSFHKY